MIGPGWLPGAPRPIGFRRTPPYTIRRVRNRSSRAAKVAAPPPAVNHEDMLFDQPPAELPAATVVSRESRTQLAADARAWASARWRWFRPRTIPLIVAFAGALAVMGSANYLRNYARRAPEQLTVSPQGDVDANNHVVIIISE